MGLFDSLTTGYLQNYVNEAPRNIAETLAARDIGQTAANVLTPAGNIASQVSTTSGLVMGAVNRITNGISVNAATVAISNIGNIISNPLSALVGSTFASIAKPEGGPPYDNVLEQFASYAPLWTLACLEPSQFNNPNSYRNSPGSLKNIVLSSGGRNDSQRVNTKYGSPEYYIDNVVLASKLGGSANAGYTNVTSFKFEVYEPYSLGIFLQSLQAAAINSGFPSYLNDCPYLLKLEFKGYKDDGSMYTGSNQLTKYFTIKITKVEFKVDEAGSRYTVEAAPMHHTGFSDVVNKTYTDVRITGMTVAEVLMSGEQSLCNKLNEEELKKVPLGQAKYPDLYEIVFPISEEDDIGLVNGTETETLKAMADPKKEKTQKTAASARAEASENFGEGAIGKSSMGFSETSGGNYNFKLAGDVIDDNGRIVRDNMTIDPKQREVLFPTETRITEMIQRIVLSSEYCVKAVKPESIDKTTGMVNWFRIDVQIQLLDYDTVRNQRAKKYIYRVVPYKVSGAAWLPPSEKAPSAGLEKIIAKRYDYLYTGQNNNIIKFDLQFNGMFYTGIAPRPIQKNDKISNQETQNAAEDKTTQGRINVGSSPEGATNASGSAPVKPNPLLTFPTATGEKTVEQMVADSFNSSFTRSMDMINVKIDIMGDPYFLSDSGICSNYIAESGPTDQVKSDGAMNWEGSDIFVYITWRNPIEPNLGTTGQGGLYNFPDGGRVTPFSGIYKVVDVEHKFSGGTYQQTLDLARQPNQDIDYEGQNKVAGTNQGLYDTSVEDPPSTGPVDVNDDEFTWDYPDDPDLPPGPTDEEIAANNASLGDFMG
jgi:hypothetical protein